MKVALFKRIQTVLEEMTINEGSEELQKKEIQKAVEAVIAAQTRNLSELAVNVSNNQAISKEDEKEELTRGNFVPKGNVDEHQADKVATEKAKAKKGKEQERNQNGKER